MKKQVFTIVFCLTITIVFAQDLIYTVSGEIDENKTSLDSILVKNISNDTRILFDNLPVLDYYQINLTKKAFWGTVGVIDIDKPQAFNVVENMPGNLTVSYMKNFSTDVKLAVYNVNGQKVFVSEKKLLNPGNSILVQLNSYGIFIVKLEAQFGIQTFKTIGADNNGGFKVDVSDQIISNVILKSEEANSDTEFSFVSGDSISVLVYKGGYIAEPQALRIDSSEFVNFVFEANSTGEVGTFTDSRDGKTYNTITIKGKEWMTDALAYLPSVNKVSSDSKTEPLFYVYNYNDTIVSEAIETENYKKYGALYNLPAAKLACPSGWHIATNDEWVQLTQFINDQHGLSHTTGDFWFGVGKYLKSTSGWDNSGNGTDDYGFNGLPGGYRHMNQNFYGLGVYGFWWTSTELTATNAIIVFLDGRSDTFTQSHNDTNYGYSIRCIKD